MLSHGIPQNVYGAYATCPSGAPVAKRFFLVPDWARAHCPGRICYNASSSTDVACRCRCRFMERAGVPLECLAITAEYARLRAPKAQLQGTHSANKYTLAPVEAVR